MPVACEYERPPPAATPVPTPTMILFRAIVGAHLALIPKKKAEAYLREVKRIMAEEEAMADTIPIRPNTRTAALSKSRKQAAEAFRAVEPVLRAGMRKE